MKWGMVREKTETLLQKNEKKGMDVLKKKKLRPILMISQRLCAGSQVAR